MRFSILIPTYNQLNCLKKCVAAVLSQTKKPFEIIISEDASSDGTPNFLVKLAQQKQIKFFSQKKNLGMIGNKEQLAHYAKGEILCFIDDDFILSPNWLLEIERSFKRYPNAGIIGGRSIQKNFRRWEKRLIYTPIHLFSILRKWMKKFLGLKIPYFLLKTEDEGEQVVDAVFGNNLAVKREVLEKLKGRDSYLVDYYEDIDLCLRARKLGYQVVYNPLAYGWELGGARDFSRLYFREIRNRVYVYLKHCVVKTHFEKLLFGLHLSWIILLSLVLGIKNKSYLKGILAIIEGYQKAYERGD